MFSRIPTFCQHPKFWRQALCGLRQAESHEDLRGTGRYRGRGFVMLMFLIPSAICSSGWFWRDPSTLPGDSRLRPPASGISRMTCSWEISVMARSKINVFHPTTGSYLGTLNDLLGTSIVVPNLWALQSGNGG